jgi:hypothetical protein
MAFAGLPFDSRVLQAFETTHTENAGRVSSRGSDFSWEQQWRALDPQHARASFVEPIARLYAAFGRELRLPFAATPGDGTAAPHERAGTAPAGTTAEGEMEEMRRYVAKLEMRLANINASWEERALRLENELNGSYLRLEAEMTELTSLRRNPIVRLLRKLGLMAATNRLRVQPR